MGAAVVVPLLLTAASTAAQVVTRKNAESLQQKQLDLQREQAEIQATDRGIQRTEKLNSVMSSNVAAAAAKGISTASPSFKAINNEAFGKFQQDEKMDSLNLQSRLAYFDTESQSVDYNAAYGMFGDISNFGEKFFNTLNLNKVKPK